MATNLNQSRRGVPSSGRQRSDGSRKIDKDHASRSIDLRGYSWRVFRGVFPRWKRFSGTLSMGNCLAMGPIRQEMMKCFAIVPAFFSGSNVKAVGLDFWIESERRAPAWGIRRPCRGARWGGGGDRRFRCAPPPAHIREASGSPSRWARVRFGGGSAPRIRRTDWSCGLPSAVHRRRRRQRRFLIVHSGIERVRFSGCAGCNVMVGMDTPSSGRPSTGLMP